MPDPGSTPAATLYLVDGYALIYRAFFAMIARPLTTRRGENTSAAWGVTNFLLRLLERRRPDYVAWVHDVGESFRHQDRKSTRLNSSHITISYAVFCLKKKKNNTQLITY